MVEPDILKQSKFTDNEVSSIKDIAVEKIFRQRNLKDYVAMELLENNFLINKWVHLPTWIMNQKYWRQKQRWWVQKLKTSTGKKHDHENILKSLKIDNDYYRKQYRSLNKKKMFLIITEIMLGSGSAITTSTISITNPNIGTVLTSSTALLTSIAILITNEYFSKLKIR